MAKSLHVNDNNADQPSSTGNYFVTYTLVFQPPTRNQRSSVPQDDPTVTGFFKCFLNSASTKGIVKKIGAKAVQVLLAHALQVILLSTFHLIPDFHLCGSFPFLISSFNEILLLLISSDYMLGRYWWSCYSQTHSQIYF